MKTHLCACLYVLRVLCFWYPTEWICQNVFFRVKILQFPEEKKGKRRLSETFLVSSPPIFLHLLSFLLSVWVVFCHRSMRASQVGYLAVWPRTLHPKCGCLSPQYRSLAALGAFALAPVSGQQPCSASEHQAFTGVAPGVVPTQPGAVMKAPVETRVYSHCNTGTCKTERVQVVKLSCLPVTLVG